MSTDLSALEAFLNQKLRLSVELKSMSDILDLVQSDQIDQQVSKFLYVTYVQSDLQISPIDSKLEYIKEIVLGSGQANIDTRELIFKVLGTKYHTYGGLDRFFYDIRPFEVPTDPSHPIVWSRVWRLNKDFDKIHLTDLVDSGNLCSFNQTLRSDRITEFREFVRMFDPLFDQNKEAYEDFVENL